MRRSSFFIRCREQAVGVSLSVGKTKVAAELQKELPPVGTRLCRPFPDSGSNKAAFPKAVNQVVPRMNALSFGAFFSFTA